MGVQRPLERTRRPFGTPYAKRSAGECYIAPFIIRFQ